MATSQVEETPTIVTNKPIAATSTGKMTSIKVQDTPFSGQTPPTAAPNTSLSTLATTKAQEPPTTWPSIPKALVEQYTLSVRPQPGASLEEIDKTIRSRIESPCGNVVWGSSRTIKPMGSGGCGGGGGAATLEMDVTYNDCSRCDPLPHVCRWTLKVTGRGGSSHLHEPLRMKDVVLLVVRGMPELVASCEVVGRRSWAVNATSVFP